MRIFSLGVAALCAIAASTAHAGHTGSALRDIVGLTVIDTSSGNAVTADFDTDQNLGSQLFVSSSTTTGTNKTVFSGQPDDTNIGSTTILATVNGGAIVPEGGAFPPFEPEVAYSGTGTAPADNAFGTATDQESTRSDSTYSGSIVDLSNDGILGGVIATGANATTLSDFNVLNANLEGSADSSVRNASIFDFIATSSITARIDYTDNVALSLVDYAPAGPAYSTFAETAFSITITESGPGGSVVLAYTNDYAIVGGDAAVNIASSAESTGTFDLVAGRAYTLTINQSSDAGFGVVPEPTSLAIFGLMGVGAVASRRRRKNG